MFKRYDGYFSRAVLIFLAATIVYLLYAEPERFNIGLSLAFGGWRGGLLLLGLGFFFLWLALRALRFTSKPCPACGGSGQGDWPTEDPSGNMIHVCGVCRGMPQDSFNTRGNWLAATVFAGLAGFCLMYGFILFSQLWRGPVAA